MTDGKIYKHVEKFVIDTFTNIGDDAEIKHLLRTVHWVKVLSPDADEALLVAAVAHDIERGFRNRQTYTLIKKSDKGTSYSSSK